MRSNKISLIYITVFISLLNTIMVFSYFNICVPNELNQIEKREMSRNPNFNWNVEALKSFFPLLESYINDNFSLREELIQYFSGIQYLIGISSDNQKVIIGKNGFMYVGNQYGKVIDYTLGKELFNEKQLLEFNEVFNLYHEYSENSGIKFYLVIPPNKHTVYPEFLPTYISPADKSRLSQLMSSDYTYNLIELGTSLTDAKEKWKQKLYYKKDSHWNEIGAYIAYREIIDMISNDFEDIKPVVLGMSNFETQMLWKSKNHLDLTSLINLKVEKVEDNISIIKPKDWNDSLEVFTFSGRKVEHKSTDFVGVDSQLIVTNKDKKHTVLVLKDSFAGALSIYLNQTFGKLIYCHYNQTEAKKLTQLVEKFKPNIIIYEKLERSIFYDEIYFNSDIKLKIKDRQFKKSLVLDYTYLNKNLKSGYQINSIKANKDGIEFIAGNNDPIIILPIKKTVYEMPILIEIDITVPENTETSIFYLTGENKAHNVKQSVSQQTIKGRNLLSFYLADQNINGSLLRLDPGSIPGKYCIHTIRIGEEIINQNINAENN